MKFLKPLKTLVPVVLILVIAVCLCGCTSSSVPSSSVQATAAQTAATTAAAGQQTTTTLAFNTSAWHYDATNDIYWQIGVGYCTKPETTAYETLGIYVPGQYFTAVANGDGTYTVSINASGTANGYTARTAPVVIPVNTGGYSQQKAPTTYNADDASTYLKAGFVYVYPGMRGRENGYDSSGNLIFSGGAPWGVTDLKAAVRYLRYNQNVLPGNTGRIFTFGMSGGGAQSAVMGVSGDSPLYYPYLTSIGAAMNYPNGTAISDAIFGAMCWCPITSLDYADEAYEWNMGQFATTGTRANTTWTSSLSADMAAAYGPYLNSLHLKDSSGTVLVLDKSSGGIYTEGTYYDYLLSVIEGSLNNFLHDTTFPYTPSSSSGGPGGMAGGAAPGGTPPGGMTGTMPAGGAPGGMPSAGTSNSSSGTASVTYNTTREYIDSLNADGVWVTYDATTNTAKITGIRDFITHEKQASKSVPAFDDMSRAQAENNLFGNDASDSLHFDPTVTDLLQKNAGKYSAYSGWNASYAAAYTTDLAATDKLGNGIQYRQDMYNPMYYLSDHYAGYRNSTPATYWRIRTGIDQGDTALTVETNLALALQQYAGVKGVDFETVWGQGHTTAERTGDSTTNFIAWVTRYTAQK